MDLTPHGEGGVSFDASDDPGRDGGLDEAGPGAASDGALADGAPRADAAPSEGDAQVPGDAALADAASDGATSSGDASALDAGTPCTNLGGVWAIKLAMALSWPASLQLDEGTTQPASIWLRLTTPNQTSDTLPGQLLLCGLTVPDFRGSAAIGGELYGLEFPLTTLDRVPPVLPNTAASVMLGSSTPGSTFALGAVAVLSGVSPNNPLTDPWPSATTLTQQDQDGDSYAGVTVPYKVGGSYSSPPISLTQAPARAASSFFAARMAFSLDGTLTSCTAASGAASMPSYDTHILGCRVVGNTRSCTVGAAPQESGVLDVSRPVWTASNVSFAAVKLSAGASCAAVRAALP